MSDIREIKLWDVTPDFDPEKGLREPCLLDYTLKGADKCVIVLPGGGYSNRCDDYEGTEIAEEFNRYGISAFVLCYRYGKYKHPIPLEDANRAVRLVRAMAGDYGYAPDKIAVMGFSAGGHLAATAVTHWDGGREDGDEVDKMSSRPDLGLLCYPVITLGNEYTHWGSTYNLLGNDFDPETAKMLSCENAVTKDTPPCFIWATAADNIVPVINSLLMAEALSENKVPFELHIYPYGRHGMALAHDDPHVETWFGLCVRFIKLHFDKH